MGRPPSKFCQNKMNLQQRINETNPSKLFLLDSLGALLSAFLLGIVLVSYEDAFGVPTKTLHILAIIALIFAFNSIYCYFRVNENWRIYMRIVSIANLLYCCLTLLLIFWLSPAITLLGISYFVLEIIVVVSLALIELQRANSSIV